MLNKYHDIIFEVTKVKNNSLDIVDDDGNDVSFVVSSSTTKIEPEREGGTTGVNCCCGDADEEDEISLLSMPVIYSFISIHFFFSISFIQLDSI